MSSKCATIGSNRDASGSPAASHLDVSFFYRFTYPPFDRYVKPHRMGKKGQEEDKTLLLTLSALAIIIIEIMSEISRRHFIKLAGAAGVIGASGLGVHLFNERGPSLMAEQWQRQSAELKSHIDLLENKERVLRLASSHDTLSGIGARLVEEDEIDVYDRFFSTSLNRAVADDRMRLYYRRTGQYRKSRKDPLLYYDHHIPKFWEQIMRDPRVPTSTLPELSNRLAQHAAHFGNAMDSERRSRRIASLERLHNVAPLDSSTTKNALHEKERLQLERDIGLFVARLNPTDELIQYATEHIEGWANSAVNQLDETPLQSVPLREVSRQSNPFS